MLQKPKTALTSWPLLVVQGRVEESEVRAIDEAVRVEQHQPLHRPSVPARSGATGYVERAPEDQEGAAAHQEEDPATRDQEVPLVGAGRGGTPRRGRRDAAASQVTGPTARRLAEGTRGDGGVGLRRTQLDLDRGWTGPAGEAGIVAPGGRRGRRAGPGRSGLGCRHTLVCDSAADVGQRRCCAGRPWQHRPGHREEQAEGADRRGQGAQRRPGQATAAGARAARDHAPRRRVRCGSRAVGAGRAGRPAGRPPSPRGRRAAGHSRDRSPGGQPPWRARSASGRHRRRPARSAAGRGRHGRQAAGLPGHRSCPSDVLNHGTVPADPPGMPRRASRPRRCVT